MYALDIDVGCPLVWTVDGLLSPTECRDLILRLEEIGFEAAPVTTARGARMMPEIRNNARVILDDHGLAGELFRRALPHIPKTFQGARAVGANERLRFYRYEPGQRFKLHSDGYFQRDEKERSYLTYMVYLNDDFEGGATGFLDPAREITPKTGTALFFQHPLRHEGREVTRGVKYALRSDVMYRAV
jgi:prolyl 4-hydroxylase